MVNHTLLSSGPLYILLIPLMPNFFFRKDMGMVKQIHSTSYSQYRNMWTWLTKGILYLGLQEYPGTP